MTARMILFGLVLASEASIDRRKSNLQRTIGMESVSSHNGTQKGQISCHSSIGPFSPKGSRDRCAAIALPNGLFRSLHNAGGLPTG